MANVSPIPGTGRGSSRAARYYGNCSAIGMRGLFVDGPHPTGAHGGRPLIRLADTPSDERSPISGLEVTTTVSKEGHQRMIVMGSPFATSLPSTPETIAWGLWRPLHVAPTALRGILGSTTCRCRGRPTKQPHFATVGYLSYRTSVSCRSTLR
jgi:hypothetical protein